MKAIILCAGYGTRLYPLTKDTAKPLLPIRNKPIVEYIVNKVQMLEQVTEIFIVTNDRFAKDFNRWLDTFSNKTFLKLINDNTKNHKDKLGAIRDLAFVVDKESLNDDLLVVGGDNLFSFTLSEFIEYSLRKRPNPLIGIYDLNGKCKADRYGIVKINEQGRVIDFYEKPSGINGSHLVSLCLYHLPKQTLSLLTDYISATKHARRTTHDARQDDLDSIGNYIKWLAKQDAMYSYEFQGDWYDIGDIDSYTEAVCSF